MIAFDIDGCVNNIKKDLIDIGKNFLNRTKLFSMRKDIILKKYMQVLRKRNIKNSWISLAIKFILHLRSQVYMKPLIF